MYQNHTVGVIGSTYDEREIGLDVAREPAYRTTRTYVIDDRSADGLLEELKDMIGRHIGPNRSNVS